MKIIVGLGNPGSKYKNNRHNIGFRCIDFIAEKCSIPVKKRLCQSDTGRGVIAGEEVLLVKPHTFVNLSGDSVACLLDKFHADLGDLLVIHDDLDLPTGRLRLRLGGRSGGHRGIKSIINCTGGQDFYRIRIGISRPDNTTSRLKDEDDIIDYVLGDFSSTEEGLIQPALASAAEAISCILAEGMTAAMNRYNRRKSS
ncbi:MAG: aminoacyl-tRNA hydrolase [Dehalococcoidia bacterium]|jgi:PTH1 family peptidyl-tRNA hydrolase